MSHHRVLLDDSALVRSQRARLSEDGVGDDDLPEVVEERPAPHLEPGGGIQLHARGDSVRVFRDPAAVAGGVGVPSVDGSRQSQDHVLGVLVLVREVFQHDERAHAREKLLRREGFGEEVRDPLLVGADLLGTRGEAGQHDDRQKTRGRVGPDRFEDLVAAPIRKLQVQEDQVGRVRRDLVETVFRRAGFLDPIARGLEQPAQELPDLGIVINDEDPSGSGVGRKLCSCVVQKETSRDCSADAPHKPRRRGIGYNTLTARPRSPGGNFFLGRDSLFRVALIEDDPEIRRLLERILQPADLELSLFASGSEFLEASGPSRFDIVVTDLEMPGASGIDVLKACRAEPEPAEVLLVTGHGTIRNAVEAMRLGAFDYLAKPADPEELRHRVRQAAETRRMKREIGALGAEVRRRHGLAPPIADSPAMREFLTHARKAAASSSTVLILGETGTGKDVIARHIQSTGPRADRTYLTINCPALPDNLVESELFGHARGAFPGAHAVKRGLFEEADGGTLFLDEIGSLTPPAQAKLLGVLEDGRVRRVGENQDTRVDVRILAATNRDLPRAVEAGEFREDLFFRLSVLTLRVPPLRERPEDIEPLARHFLAESARRLGKLRVFAPEALDFLRSYRFPGNVRELRYAIEEAVILSSDGVLRPGDFAFARRASDRPSGRGTAGEPERRFPPRSQITPELLQRVLREQGGNRVRTARALGISRATLYRLLGPATVKAAEERPD